MDTSKVCLRSQQKEIEWQKLEYQRRLHVQDKSHISEKGMDGLCFTYLWFWLCRNRKVILHYEYAKTNDSSSSTINAVAKLQKELQKVVATATLFRIKQWLTVFSHMQIKRFDKENKENYSVGARKYGSETEKIRRHRL